MVGITDTNDGKILENTSDLYNEIATNYPSNNYSQFCNQFGVRFAQSENILKQHLKDYGAAVKQVLNIWEAKGNATRAKLESALKKAETGALCTIVEEHFANEPVTVHQSGGAQTINASGRAKVKGSTMTGPVTNMTIHNHHAEASTSQRQGRKRKAAASSGGKKGRKVGRKR